jgi:hypothetical protein
LRQRFFLQPRGGRPFRTLIHQQYMRDANLTHDTVLPNSGNPAECDSRTWSETSVLVTHY